MIYQSFIFSDYSFDRTTKELKLYYSFDSILNFTEKYKFDFDFADYDEQVLDRAIQGLFFMAGVSYFKAYPLANIVVRKGQLDPTSANFFAKTYQKGLGEFFFVNKLDPQTKIQFPTNIDRQELLKSSSTSSGMLVGIGGGKDSLVSVELLKPEFANLATFSVGHRKQLTLLIERIGIPHYWVEREWDRQLVDLKGSLNGHIPISAILASVGVVVAVLSGRRDVVVSNESSANEPTLVFRDTEINHQYSKSQEFEHDFQQYLKEVLGDSVHYFSFLRPLSEVAIAKIFAQVGFDKYKDVFSSCNKAFTADSDHIFWDGSCPKCAFVFLALTPFIERDKLEQLFNSNNLLLDPDLKTTYRQLLGVEGDRPLECVGEIKESRAAMKLAQEKYPELASYSFELPEDYDFRSLGKHTMPDNLYQFLLSSLETLL